MSCGTLSKTLEIYRENHRPSEAAGVAVRHFLVTKIGGGTSEEDETRNTLGTMLRQLRIDPATLGWDEQMETFID